MVTLPTISSHSGSNKTPCQPLISTDLYEPIFVAVKVGLGSLSLVSSHLKFHNLSVFCNSGGLKELYSSAPLWLLSLFQTAFYSRLCFFNLTFALTKKTHQKFSLNTTPRGKPSLTITVVKNAWLHCR